MQSLIDYRNAKYQGEINSTQSRNGFGILVDDDLSFYASTWKDGKLNNATMIYINHGKYIYGEWKNNEPHGLNVFRIGDTVVLGQFNHGELEKKVIIIFEKFNFLAILEKQREEWYVSTRGVLKSYNDLIKYIEEARIPMQPQYFSLAKFISWMPSESAQAVPCQGSQNCYFGFDQGLGIIFNSNNGVVSVGCHSNKKLVEFGGKYQLPNFVMQGNFSTNQIIKYSNERPKMQIYSIFQKLHKRSLNFKNQYFDSKVKILTHVQQLIRAKIQEIVNQNSKTHENTFTALDLNDSLDYHAENLEEINKLNKIREDVYEVAHVPFKKTTSEYVESTPNERSSQVYKTPSKKSSTEGVSAPASPILMKKSPIKNKQKQKTKERQMMKTPSKREISYSNKEHYHLDQNTFAKEDFKEPPLLKAQSSTSDIEIPRSIRTSVTKKSEENQPKSTYYKQKQSREEIYGMTPITTFDQPLSSSKNYMRKKQLYVIPSFKCTDQDYQKNDKPISKLDRLERCPQRINKIQIRDYNLCGSNKENRIQRYDQISVASLNISANKELNTSKSPIKGPNYENLSERRRRLLKQFKNLNKPQENPPSVLTKIAYQITNKLTPSKNSFTSSKNIPQQTSIQSNLQYESPCIRENIPSYESKNVDCGQQFIPLSLNYKKQFQNADMLTPTRKKNYKYYFEE